MPKLSGLSLLKTIQQKPNVIITTAYPEYAVEGFELSVTDYLLKPFSLERFLKSISKVQQLTQNNAVITEIQKEEATTTLFVKSDKKIIKLELKEITHIEAYGNYIKIFTDIMVLTPQTLTEFLEKLPSNFLRIHKSFAINFNQLKLIEGNQIVLHNETKLPIGKLYRKIILDRI
jgi:DNA-binding LytR/AlgR family response regulator